MQAKHESRLSCSDPALFTRYSKGVLKCDLYLKPSLSSAGYAVSLAILQTFSDRLADFALAASDDGLVLEEDDQVLRLFVEAMYGRSLKQTCLVAEDMKNLVCFGHKYNIEQMEPALCEVLAQRDHKALEWAGLDAVFSLLLAYGKSHGLKIENHEVVLSPRNVTSWLQSVNCGNDDCAISNVMRQSLQYVVSRKVNCQTRCYIVLQNASLLQNAPLLQFVFCRFTTLTSGTSRLQSLF